MNDDRFLGYVEWHCETDLALFSREHANRLLALAGRAPQNDLPDFVAIHADVAKPLVTAARSRRQT